MTLVLFAVSVFMLLIVAFFINNRSIVSPAVLFTTAFFVLSVFALVGSVYWDYEMSDEALFVLMVGISAFVLAASLIHKAFFSRLAIPQDHKEWILPVRQGVLILVALFQSVTFVLTLVQISEMYPADSIQSSIGLFDKANKFTDEGVAGFAFPLGPMRNISLVFSYITCYLLVQELALRRYGNLVLPIVCCLISMGISLETGARSGCIAYVIYVIAGFFLMRKRIDRHESISAKTIVIASIGIIVVISFFQESLSLIGRSNYSDFWEYLAIYLGAELPNFDIFLHGGVPTDNTIWGSMTFSTSINWVGKLLDISGWSYPLDLPFQVMNDHNLGNVYTTFYAPIYDFGIGGMLITTIVMAVFSQCVYENAMRTKSRFGSCIATIAFMFIANALIMSFFSNKFYENVLTLQMARTLIYFLICYFVYICFPKINGRTALYEARPRKRANTIGNLDT